MCSPPSHRLQATGVSNSSGRRAVPSTASPGLPESKGSHRLQWRGASKAAGCQLRTGIGGVGEVATGDLDDRGRRGTIGLKSAEVAKVVAGLEGRVGGLTWGKRFSWT